MLRQALVTAGVEPLTVDDGSGTRFGATVGTADRWARRLVALSTRPRPLRHDAATARLIGADLYRLAHVHAALRRRTLRLSTDLPRGIVHWSYPVPLRIEGWANIYTVHDAIPLDHPALTTIDGRALRQRVRRLARSADRIVTVSQDSRARIVDAFGLDPARVVDCSSAVGPPLATMPLPAGLTRRGYFLICGVTDGRKNLTRTIAAWRTSGSTRPLVIVGPDGDQHAELAVVAAATPGLVLLGYRERPVVETLIASARALLLVSLAEGFGLPVAEAMAAGTPVLTAGTGALAETAGGAALLVDPHDEGAIAAAVRRLDRDDELIAELTARGLQRATSFTPAVFGARLLTLYREVAAARGWHG